MSSLTPSVKRFGLYSIGIELSGARAGRIAQDFDFYTDRPQAGKNRYSVSLHIDARAPSAGDLPALKADRVFSDCVMYREGNRLFYEYPGAVLQVDREGRQSRGHLLSLHPDLTDEIAYLFLQSEIGRFLDQQGLHRVHALGIGLPSGKAALVLLPSGGGKSTLALELLQGEGCTLLSDDSPLVDRFGRVHPYLLRLSFRPDAVLPEKWKEKSVHFERRKHGPKTLVAASALPRSALPRPDESFRPGFLVIGERHGNREEPHLSRLGKLRSALPLFRDLVVGLGVPQVAELVLADGLKSLPGLAPTGASRLLAASAFLAQAQTLRFELSRDSKRNARYLIDHLERAR